MKFDKKRYFNLLNSKKRTKAEEREFVKLSELRESLNYNAVDPFEDGLYEARDPYQMRQIPTAPSYNARDPHSTRRTEAIPSDYAFDSNIARQPIKESAFVPYTAQDSNSIRQPIKEDPFIPYTAQDPNSARQLPPVVRESAPVYNAQDPYSAKQPIPVTNEPAPSYVAQDPHPVMKDPILNDKMSNYLASEGGAYGTADNEISTVSAASAFGGMGENPEPTTPLTPEYIAEVQAKGGSFMADGSVSYPDVPAFSDRMQKINTIRDKEAAIARSNRLAAIEFDKTKMGVDSSAFYPEGTVIGGVMGTDDNAMLDANDNIVPVPPVARKAKPYRTRQQRIDDMNKKSANKTKSGVNPKTGKNTVKIAKNPYGKTPYVSKSKIAKDAASISLPKRGTSGMNIGGRKEIDIGGNLVNSNRFATVDPLNLFGNKNGVNPFSSSAGTDRFSGGYVSNRKVSQDTSDILDLF